MDKKEEILRILPMRLKEEAGRTASFETLQEIRLRPGRPMLFLEAGRERVSNCLVSEKEIGECLQYAGNYSLYAYEEELRGGYLTIRGGHRIGLAGQVRAEQGQVRVLKQVSSLNIRVAHEIKGCAASLLSPLFGDGKLKSVLLISPPGGGKTTCLRDLIRLMAEGESPVGPVNVGVVDERSELGACYQGIPQNDLGLRSDVLDGCPKAAGIYMLLRSMAPDVIAVDEISLVSDAEAVEYAAGCGCSFLATLHGESEEAVKKRPAIKKLWEQKIFERYVLLGKKPAGRVLGIYNKEFERLFDRGPERGERAFGQYKNSGSAFDFAGGGRHRE
ncbi:MAG: stage III sporulation protein AA [Lachnospiraceae bacterium]|nr:stage III sporulation protein AA [Lachnospiraceae bacterium]